jgi:polyisoprenoid-binding protein YceI
MLRTAAVLALAVALAAPASAEPKTTDPAKIPAGTYEMDKRHASLVLRVAHLGGFSKYTMRFNGLDGSFAYDPAAWQAAKVTIRVDPTSIDTGDRAFDKQIAGYFDVQKFPAILFTSTGLTADGPRGQLTGDLTFHGVTKPVVLDVTFNGVGPGMTGLGTRLGFSGTGRIKRSDFGVTSVRQFAGDEVDLAFEVEFVKR